MGVLVTDVEGGRVGVGKCKKSILISAVHKKMKGISYGSVYGIVREGKRNLYKS